MSYEYTVGGQSVRLDPDPTVVAVRFKPGPKSSRAGATAAAGVGSFSDRFEVPGEELTLVPTTSTPSALGPAPERATMAIKALNARDEVSHALPVFRVAGNQVITTDRVIIGLDRPEVAEVAKKHGLEVLKAEPNRILVRVGEGADPFVVSQALNQEPGVLYAEPDFVTIGRHVPKRVGVPQPPILNDPLIGRQYAMTITGTVEAWKIQDGDPAIRIAVLDEGVQTTHPDLASAIVDPFDAIESDVIQEPNSWDGHGTSCAGLAAAIGGNQIGIRGVAAGASILPVRIAYSRVPEGPWVTSNSVIREGIKWAWEHGADVLSNSWGGGAPSNDISAEFNHARTKGRRGLGCVVVVAAGNTFNQVQFPANLPHVLTVAASNEYDEAKTPTSRDGETWWGTCHGPEIDIAAPGVHNMTTDIGAGDGYTPDDYVPNFNGTSSATPLVAGACALVLSANPDLTGGDVTDIITTTAEKVGQFPYKNGRNDYFGVGRLNVLAAVQLAQQRRSASSAGFDPAASATAK